MLHLALHFLIPLAIARLAFADRWWQAWLWLLSAFVIDLDHLLADPIYDPLRCSIGFHPLHSELAIGFYALLLICSQHHRVGIRLFGQHRQTVNLIAIGLGIHIALDSLDCVF